MTQNHKGDHHGKWTPERFAAASEMWRIGKSAGEIARAMNCGFSRNSVIGKMHRAGVATGSPKHGPSNFAARVSGGLRAVKIAPTKRTLPRDASVPRPPNPYTRAAPLPLDVTHAKPWEARMSNECAWIIDDSPEVSIACCAPVCEAGADHQWCSAHHRVGTSVTGSARDLARSVRRFA